MDARYIKNDKTLDYTPSTDVAAGEVVVFDQLIAIAKSDIKAGRLGSLALTGIYEFPKIADDAFDIGNQVNWDEESRQVVEEEEDGVWLGYVVAPAAEGTTTVQVML